VRCYFFELQSHCEHDAIYFQLSASCFSEAAPVGCCFQLSHLFFPLAFTWYMALSATLIRSLMFSK
jgi:hypothetical protein